MFQYGALLNGVKSKSLHYQGDRGWEYKKLRIQLFLSVKCPLKNSKEMLKKSNIC